MTKQNKSYFGLITRLKLIFEERIAYVGRRRHSFRLVIVFMMFDEFVVEPVVTLAAKDAEKAKKDQRTQGNGHLHFFSCVVATALATHCKCKLQRPWGFYLCPCISVRMRTSMTIGREKGQKIESVSRLDTGGRKGAKSD